MTKTIAERLQSIKEETGAIYSEIAKAVGVHATTIRSYTLGKTIPSQETIEKIAEFFNIQPHEIDETLTPSDKVKRVFRYTDASQPSVKKTQAAYVSLALRGYKDEMNLTASDLFELLDRKVSISTLQAILTGLYVPNDEVFELIESKLGLEREEIDPFYLNGSEIDFGKVIHYRALALITEANIKMSDVDKALGFKSGKFSKSFNRVSPETGKYVIPQYAYIKDVADLFGVPASEIDPFTNPDIIEFVKNL